jgi:hypothetical protein
VGPTVATIPNPTVDASAIDENNNRKVLRKVPIISNSIRRRTVICSSTHTDDEDGL